MVTRRTYLATVSIGAVGALAGCALLSDTIEAEAGRGIVTEERHTAAGFADEERSETTFDDTREVAGEERDLRLTNKITEYRKQPSQDTPKAAGFLVFSSPTVSIADRSFNPFDEFDEKRLIRRVLSGSRQAEPDDLEEAGSETVSVLEESVELTEYVSTQTVEGQEIDVRIHIGNLTHDGDVIVLVGSYPQIAAELENIQSMAEGVDHPVDD